MDLAARDNIRINAVMLGLSPRDARQREDEIIDFAGLRGFEDLKIKNYSSGMLVRLGFAIMAHVDADVLLIDEVLAVGDAAFQQKCYDQFNRIRDEGRTVLFVTHDMGAVERYCDRALLLEHGEMVTIGEPREVGQEYLRLNFARGARRAATRPRATPEEATIRSADRRARVDRRGVVRGRRRRRASTSLPHGEPGVFAAQRALQRAGRATRCSASCCRTSGDETVFAASTAWTQEQHGHVRGRARRSRLPRHASRRSSRRDGYNATPAVARRGQGIAWIDRREELRHRRRHQHAPAGRRGRDPVRDQPRPRRRASAATA